MKRRTGNSINTILGMTEEDVLANGQGNLSSRQKEKIQDDLYRTAAISSASLVLALVSIPFAILGAIAGQGNLFSGLFAIFGPILFFYFGFRAFQNWKVLSNPPQVESVTGQVSKHIHDNEAWYIIVGGQRFEVGENIFNAFIEKNGVYTVYYIRPGCIRLTFDRILSVREELDD
jgi:hypothetical protein